jgi:hypothetical protein
MSSEKYIGLDVHQATISIAVMDSSGKVVMESILETKAATGQNSGSGNSPPSRATASAIGLAAAAAPASAKRTLGGKRQACHYRQVTTDPLVGPDSLRLGGSPHSDTASFSQQATALDLQRTGIGNPRQRGIPLRARPDAAAQKAGDDSRIKQGPQS